MSLPSTRITKIATRFARPGDARKKAICQPSGENSGSTAGLLEVKWVTWRSQVPSGWMVPVEHQQVPVRRPRPIAVDTGEGG